MDKAVAEATAAKHKVWQKALWELTGNNKSNNFIGKLGTRKTLFENIRAEECVDDVQWNPWTPLLTKFPMKNAMFDFEEFCLTVADPDDMIQFTTGYDWPTDPDGNYIMPAQEDVQFVLDFFAEITGDDNQFKYLLVLMAASLEGCNRFNEFVLMCGGGGNGKGLMMNLMAQVCGDLMQQLTPDFYQSTKGKDSAAPSPQATATAACKPGSPSSFTSRRRLP